MTITIIAVGKLKDKPLTMLQDEYAKRLQSFAKIEVAEVKDEPDIHPDRESECAIAKSREAQRVLEKLRPSDFVILLDLHGTQWTSEEFAAQLEKWQSSAQRLVFVIAGSLGPGEALTARANVRWQLSRLTFTHLMTRVLVLEQIYRGYMINSGRTYHK